MSSINKDSACKVGSLGMRCVSLTHTLIRPLLLTGDTSRAVGETTYMTRRAYKHVYVVSLVRSLILEGIKVTKAK